jgi:hypothetical protein
MLEPGKLHNQGIDEQLGSRALLTTTVAYALLSGVALLAVGTLPGAAETGAGVA